MQALKMIFRAGSSQTVSWTMRQRYLVMLCNPYNYQPIQQSLKYWSILCLLKYLAFLLVVDLFRFAWDGAILAEYVSVSGATLSKSSNVCSRVLVSASTLSPLPLYSWLLPLPETDDIRCSSGSCIDMPIHSIKHKEG